MGAYSTVFGRMDQRFDQTDRDGSNVITFDPPIEGMYIRNTGAASLTMTFSGQSYVLAAGAYFREMFGVPYSAISFAGATTFEGYPLTRS